MLRLGGWCFVSCSTWVDVLGRISAVMILGGGKEMAMKRKVARVLLYGSILIHHLERGINRSGFNGRVRWDCVNQVLLFCRGFLDKVNTSPSLPASCTINSSILGRGVVVLEYFRQGSNNMCVEK